MTQMIAQIFYVYIMKDHFLDKSFMLNLCKQLIHIIVSAIFKSQV